VKLGGHASSRVRRERQYFLVGTAGVLLLLARGHFLDGVIEVEVIPVGLPFLETTLPTVVSR
jgi:hypothetical protein